MRQEGVMEFMGGRVEIIEGDITRLEVDTIVNAANKSLLGGGGVDGAIHRGAGPGLLQETRTLGGAQTGEAKITGGYNLAAKHVIHTVGPVWHGGRNNEDGLLADCYRNSLKVAVENDCQTVAFPAISTGVYSFPLERATDIALGEIKAFLEKDTTIDRVTCCCFGKRDYDTYVETAGRLFA
jgi:O-acetyl-ADP-ribose deacetylase (regulator of RNase III)